MSLELVRYAVEERIATVTINRPDARNSLSPQVISELRQALDGAAADPAVGVVVLTGAGDRAFCAGGDLGPSGMMTADTGVVGAHHSRGEFGRLLVDLVNLPRPTVARVNGHALGGGLGLAAACDITIAADTATFGTPEITVGLFPMMIMAVLVRTLGRKRTLELMLTGDRLDAATAERYGLVNRVVTADRLDATVHEVASKVAGFSPAVLQLGRRAFATMSDMEFGKAVEYLNTMLTLNLLTDDAMEGISAFVGKRKPEWRGR